MFLIHGFIFTAIRPIVDKNLADLIPIVARRIDLSRPLLIQVQYDANLKQSFKLSSLKSKKLPQGKTIIVKFDRDDLLLSSKPFAHNDKQSDVRKALEIALSGYIREQVNPLPMVLEYSGKLYEEYMFRVISLPSQPGSHRILHVSKGFAYLGTKSSMIIPKKN